MEGPILRAADRSVVRRSVSTDCQVVAEHGFRLLGVRTVDLSPEGLLLKSQEDARVGDSVIVSLRAPGTRLWIDAEGTVVRVCHGRRQRDRCPTVGVRFDRVDRSDGILLHESLRGLPPPIPRRSIRHDYAKTVRLIFQYSQLTVRNALDQWTEVETSPWGLSPSLVTA